MIFYDFEVFKYDWLVVFMDSEKKETKIIINDREQLVKYHEENKERIFVGYNSRHYDQYIFKAILCDFDPYKMSKHIIEKKKGGWSFSNLLRKVQLYNFDIMSSFHGLKQLEGFMGNDIRETTVPFDIDRSLTDEELSEVVEYCRHDVEQTIHVFMDRIEEFTSHLSLIKAFGLPLQYFNKTKTQLSAMILGAKHQERDDEFDLILPDTLDIKKYAHVVEWYKNPDNLDYSKSLKVDVAGVPHIFAWGGLHGAIENYHGEGIYMNMDVASLYPAIMIEYNFLSRNVLSIEKYREIRDTRLVLKKKKDPMQAPYKIVLNGTYGAMKDKYNPLYDPRQANNVCVAGQLLLLDLIEKLEDHCQLIQSNTDGLFIKLRSRRDIPKIKRICAEWEKRTRLELDFDMFERIYQKDVNNYIVIHEDNSYKSKGAYVKKLSNLDNDLPIVNKAVVEYFVNGIDPEETINECNEMIKFQKIVKVSSKYQYALHGSERVNEKVLRVFASRRKGDYGVYKVKNAERVEKIANTPEKCFIRNEDINGQDVPRRLDRKWYIDVSKKRINDFLGQKAV